MANLMSWQDGELTHSPQISATNRGYLVGQGVFETLLVTNGRAEFLDRHLDRLARSWPRIGPGEIPQSSVIRGVAEVLAANGEVASLARLRITATLLGDQPSILVTVVPMEPWPETTTCIVLPWRANESSPLTGIKSTSYAANIVGMQWAQERGFSEGLYLNSQGFLVEGTSTNIFLVVNNEIVTPAAECGPLPGIIRGLLLENELAREMVLTETDLDNSSEMFLTSSTRGIHPVERCGERVFESPGPGTTRAMAALQELRDRQRT
ncbi:MAG: aminotransferase class IV [Candidatus Nanopelagicales bacterium]|nr:aminotransferase class IV [Candidatus Nanopelagicales bacterium]